MALTTEEAIITLAAHMAGAEEREEALEMEALETIPIYKEYIKKVNPTELYEKVKQGEATRENCINALKSASKDTQLDALGFAWIAMLADGKIDASEIELIAEVARPLGLEAEEVSDRAKKINATATAEINERIRQGTGETETTETTEENQTVIQEKVGEYTESKKTEEAKKDDEILDFTNAFDVLTKVKGEKVGCLPTLIIPIILGFIVGAIVIPFSDALFIDYIDIFADNYKGGGAGATAFLVFFISGILMYWIHANPNPIKVKLTHNATQNENLNKIKSSFKGISSDPNFQLTDTLCYGITNMEFPKFGDEIYFLPEGVACGNKNDFELILYNKDLLKTKEIEESREIEGAQCISRRWKYRNKDGSEDKRRKDNIQYFTYNLTILEIKKHTIKLYSKYEFPKL